MPSLHTTCGISRRGLLSIAAHGIAFCWFGVIANPTALGADEPTIDDIREQLRNPKPATASRRKRGGPSKPHDDATVVEEIRAIRRRRGLNLQERNRLYEVSRDKPQLNLVVYFPFNSAEVTAQSQATLDRLGSVLSEPDFNQRVFSIEGHTDRKGSAKYNLALSQRRADAVAKYLIQNYGVEPDQLLTTGYGFERLKDKGKPYAGLNRRVRVVNLANSQ